MLAVCLAGGALTAPAGAAKKQPPAAGARTYYLTQGGDASCDKALRTKPSSTSQSQCLDVGAGVVNEGWATFHGEECDPDASGETDRCVPQAWVAADGLPFRLDTTRTLTGTIYVASLGPIDGIPVAAGAGSSTLHVSARARVDGSAVVLGRFTADYVVTPVQQVYEIPFEIELDPSLDGGSVTKFAVDVWSSGVTVGHGVYVPDTSNVVVPTRGR